jgi:peroxiredoxin
MENMVSVLPLLLASQIGIGMQAPDVVLRDMQNQPVRLSQFRGKKVVLFAWASW